MTLSETTLRFGELVNRLEHGLDLRWPVFMELLRMEHLQEKSFFVSEKGFVSTDGGEPFAYVDTKIHGPSTRARGSWLLGNYSEKGVIILAPRQASGCGDFVITLGRSRQCDIHIDAVSVSRIHARVAFDADTANWHITDAGSHHGSHLNGEQLLPNVPALILSEARLSLGEVAGIVFEPQYLKDLFRQHRHH